MHEKESAKDIFNEACERMQGLYPSTEAESLIHWLMEDLLGLTRVRIVLGDPMPQESESFGLAVDRLATGEPIQYILGYAWFRGLKFMVAPGVLIPRPETELLVDWTLKGLKSGSRILDVGTGSGCIAISVALGSPDAKVMGWDLSTTALEVAQKNATQLNAKVQFEEVNVLQPWPDVTVDCIVSNPPYVLESEKVEMHKNVLGFEPGQALFVPDDDPLRYYRAIAVRGRDSLNEAGRIVFEINERFGTKTAALLDDLGYRDVVVVKDHFGKDRVVTGRV